jgi:glycosyltransferase involved in cell wall biosynthesis
VEDPQASAIDSVVDFSLGARRKGFLDLLDPGTFYTRPSDLAVEPMQSMLDPLSELPLALSRHPFIAGLVQQERQATTSPFGLAFAAARAKVLGLRVLIDGSCLGPQEMGTQVTLLALVRALAERADVADVGVALVSAVPSYAAGVLALPNVRPVRWGNGPVSDFGRADIGHRPMQPDASFDIDAWREAADRILVSVLDLIAYQIGSYHPSGAAWLRYRDVMQRVVNCVDGVAVISEDVGVQVATERLPVDPTRLVVAPYGCDHLTGAEPASVPLELLARGYTAGEFLLTIGANYTHKNRDLAVRTLQVLRNRGHKLSLVLVGAGVPHGSSRALEDRARGWDDDEVIFVLPDVTSEERNWLLRHASVVLYPTGAEGFGLVPFEAARFGTPTVYVPFGPLAEVAGSPPGLPSDWDPEGMADSVERLIADPSAVERHVSATLAAGESYTWARTADLLVSAYRRLLSQPPRSKGPREGP